MHTRDVLMAKFAYDPETGQFIHRYGLRPGAVAGSVAPNGYVVLVAPGGKHYQAHRVAMLFQTGEWPKEDVDHINGNRADNRFMNLRLATRTENLRNGGSRASRTGYRGVVIRDKAHKRIKKYAARIKVDGKIIFLGNFADPADAHEAYKAAAKQYFGEFARA